MPLNLFVGFIGILVLAYYIYYNPNIAGKQNPLFFQQLTKVLVETLTSRISMVMPYMKEVEKPFRHPETRVMKNQVAFFGAHIWDVSVTPFKTLSRLENVPMEVVYGNVAIISWNNRHKKHRILRCSNLRLRRSYKHC